MPGIFQDDMGTFPCHKYLINFHGKSYIISVIQDRKRPRLGSTSCVAASRPVYLSPSHIRLVFKPPFTNDFRCNIFLELWLLPLKLALYLSLLRNNGKAFVGPSCTDVDVSICTRWALLGLYHCLCANSVLKNTLYLHIHFTTLIQGTFKITRSVKIDNVK